MKKKSNQLYLSSFTYFFLIFTAILAITNFIFFESDKLGTISLVLFGIVILLTIWENKGKKLICLLLIVTYLYLIYAWYSPMI